MIFPWQEGQWRQLMAAPERLPHALLLHGRAGSGKSEFAETLAAKLLCEGQGQFACGLCAACKWFALGNHPDFRKVVPAAEAEAEEAAEGQESGDEGEAQAAKKSDKKASEQIVIDQIRDLADFANVGTHRQGRRVVIIRPAEAMNIHTANSLLKLLEEPTPGTLFLLVSNNLAALLPTIRSRCRLVRFGRPDADAALAWLKQQNVTGAEDLLAVAGGMPLAAASLADGELAQRHKALVADLAQPGSTDPLTLAAQWETWVKPPKVGGKAAAAKGERLTLAMLVSWWQKWLFDLALVKQGGAPLFHPAAAARLQALASGATIAGLFGCYNDLLRAGAMANHPLNTRLFLEDLLLRYVRLFARRRA